MSKSTRREEVTIQRPESASIQTIEGHGQPPPMSWSVHLSSANRRGRGVVLWSLIGAFAIGVLVLHSIALALLTPLALAGALSEFLFPIRYTLTATHARASCGVTVLEMAWSDVKHAYLMPDGIKLSPLRTANSRFERCRGIFLRLDADRLDEAIALVRRLREDSRRHV